MMTRELVFVQGIVRGSKIKMHRGQIGFECKRFFMLFDSFAEASRIMQRSAIPSINFRNVRGDSDSLPANRNSVIVRSRSAQRRSEPKVCFQQFWLNFQRSPVMRSGFVEITGSKRNISKSDVPDRIVCPQRDDVSIVESCL